MKKILFLIFILTFTSVLISKKAANQGSKKKDLSARIKILINQLNSTSKTMQQTSAKNQLKKMGKDGLPYLIDSLKNDKRTYVRVQIAFILGAMKNQSTIPALEKTAKSKYAALKKAAIISIGNIGGEKATSSLKRLRKKTTDPNLIKTIEKALKKAKSPEKKK